METLTKKDINLQKIESYLRETSKHLFLTEDGKFSKTFPINVGDKLFAVTMKFNGDSKPYIFIRDIDSLIRNYGNDSKCVLKDEIFPPYYEKRASIINFKAMKEKMEEVKKYMQETFNGENCDDVTKIIKEMLLGLEPKIKEQGE